MNKGLLLLLILVFCQPSASAQSQMADTFTGSEQEGAITIDREYTHWYQKDKLTKWFFRQDLYAFRLVDQELYRGYQAPCVDSIVPYQNKYSIFNLVYFSEGSSTADRMKFVREIRREPRFEFESGPVTQHPNALRSENLFLFSGDRLNVVFREPRPSPQLIEWTEDRYGLKVLHIPDAVLPAPVDRSWAFQFQLLHNTTRPRDVFQTAYEMYLNDSAVFMIAEPTLEPADASAGILSSVPLNSNSGGGEVAPLSKPIESEVSELPRAPVPPSTARVDSTNDPYYPYQWHIENTGQCMGMWRRNGGLQLSGTPGADCNIKEAWAAGFTGEGITIAVVDFTIFNDSHPDISSKFVGGYNFVNNSPDVYSCQSCPGVYQSHGQACAGLIGAIPNNGIGTVGVAYDADIVPYTTYAGDSYLAFQQAILDSVDVISSSWLYSGNFAAALESDIENCFLYGRNGKGIVMVFPAGNRQNRLGENMDNSPTAVFPSALPTVIGVIGSTPDDKVKSTTDLWELQDTTGAVQFDWSSNFGTVFELAAPSTDIITTDQYLPNSTLFSLFWKDHCSNPPLQLDTGYAYFNGTSAATAIVAGVCAMVLQNDTNFTATQVRNILQNTADEVGGYNYSYNSAGQSLRFSHGRLNAYNAAIVGRREALVKKQIIAEIFPNPSQDRAQLKAVLRRAGDLQIEITDLLGNKVYFDTRNNLYPNTDYLFNFDLSAFPEGVYLVHCKSYETIQTLKLILHR